MSDDIDPQKSLAKDIIHVSELPDVAMEEEDIPPLDIPFKDDLTKEELAILRKIAEENWPTSLNGILKSSLRYREVRRIEGMGSLSALKESLTYGFYRLIHHGRFRKEAQRYVEDQKEEIAFDKIGSSQEYLGMFFQSNVLQRLIYCPEINRDMTDDWGMFGCEPGFILIRGLRYKGVQTLADKAALSGYSTGDKVRVKGIEIPQILHFDYFPRHKFEYNLMTPTRLPEFYNFLNAMLNTKSRIQVSKN